MKCDEFRDRLEAQFENQRFDDAPDLTDHAGHCPTCRTTLEQYRLLSDSLGVWRDQVPDVDLTDAVVAAWRSQASAGVPTSLKDKGQVVSPRREAAAVGPRSHSASQAGIVARPFRYPAWSRPRHAALWLTAGSLVGALLLAFTLIRSFNEAPQTTAISRDGTTPVSPPLRSKADVDIQDEKVHVAASPPPIAPEADRDVYSDLAQKAAGALGEVTVYVMPSPGTMSSGHDRPGGAATGWIDGVKRQLKPIGRGLDNAFDFLWEAGQSADSSKT